MGQQVSRSEIWSPGPAVTLPHYTTWGGALHLSQAQCSLLLSGNEIDGLYSQLH